MSTVSTADVGSGESGSAPTPDQRSSSVPLLAGSWTFLMVIAYFPRGATPFTDAKACVLALGGAAGLPVLVTSARHGDRTARAALAFGAWSVASALASRSALAWSGPFGEDTGCLFVLAAVGVFGA